jgi:hypothetical protein
VEGSKRLVAFDRLLAGEFQDKPRAGAACSGAISLSRTFSASRETLIRTSQSAFAVVFAERLDTPRGDVGEAASRDSEIGDRRNNSRFL